MHCSRHRLSKMHRLRRVRERLRRRGHSNRSSHLLFHLHLIYLFPAVLYWRSREAHMALWIEVLARTRRTHLIVIESRTALLTDWKWPHQEL